MAGDAPNIINDTASTTAAPFALTNKCKQVRVTNRDATNSIGVFVGSSNASSAAAKASVTTGTGTVAGAVASNVDDNWIIAPGQSSVVFKSNAGRFVALSVISSAGTPLFRAEGTIWKD